MMVRFRRPAADATMLAPGMAFGGGVIRQIRLDPVSDGPQAYDPYVFIEVEVEVVAERGHGPDCRVYWGSHGCRYPRGHYGAHECDCCKCADHAKSNEIEPGVTCVAKPPYYGPQTKFYGEDVKPDVTDVCAFPILDRLKPRRWRP